MNEEETLTSQHNFLLLLCLLAVAYVFPERYFKIDFVNIWKTNYRLQYWTLIPVHTIFFLHSFRSSYFAYRLPFYELVGLLNVFILKLLILLVEFCICIDWNAFFSRLQSILVLISVGFFQHGNIEQNVHVRLAHLADYFLFLIDERITIIIFLSVQIGAHFSF